MTTDQNTLVKVPINTDFDCIEMSQKRLEILIEKAILLAFLKDFSTLHWSKNKRNGEIMYGGK